MAVNGGTRLPISRSSPVPPGLPTHVAHHRAPGYNVVDGLLGGDGVEYQVIKLPRASARGFSEFQPAAGATTLAILTVNHYI